LLPSGQQGRYLHMGIAPLFVCDYMLSEEPTIDTIEAPVEPMAPEAEKPSSTPVTKEIARQIEVCRKDRRDLIEDWTDNVEFHRGKPFQDDSDRDRIALNKDWPRVKARVAMLFGQMPEVRLKPKQEAFAAGMPVFAKELNDTLKRADADEAIFQALTDHTATSGIGVVLCTYQKRTDIVQQEQPMDVSMLPPEIQMQLMATGQPPPMEAIDQEVTTDALFGVSRLSPSNLLWQTAFTGFNFDKSDLIGHTGEMNWAEAQNEFSLQDDVKEKVLGQGKEVDQTLKQNDPDQPHEGRQEVVEYDEVFYWAYRFDPMEKYFKRIKRIVFVRGLTDPVVHEDWAGQRFDEQAGTYVGACRFPIRCLKTAYVSDDPIPPCESAIGRPQVLELMDFHDDQRDQRKRNKPIRGINTNKVDPDTITQIMRGDWQGFVPINGRVEDAIGEVGRANYPPENQMFERTTNQHLDDVWQSGSNQAGNFASGERSASEARIVQANFDLRNGLDRGHVAKFIQGIAEVMAGFIALYGEFEGVSEEDMERLGSLPPLAGEFLYEVIPDSMVRLDAHQQIQLIMDILNNVAKSGFINPSNMIGEVLNLAGFDPAKNMVQPNPPMPPPLNISIRSAEDLHDPLMLALLASTNQLFTPQQLQAAKNIVAAAKMPEGMPVPGSEEPPSEDEPQGGAPSNSATKPEDMMVMEKISKRSDYE
jgi:hypothetical protein